MTRLEIVCVFLLLGWAFQCYAWGVEAKEAKADYSLAVGNAPLPLLDTKEADEFAEFWGDK